MTHTTVLYARPGAAPIAGALEPAGQLAGGGVGRRPMFGINEVVTPGVRATSARQRSGPTGDVTMT
jgi:hypothetical protein